MFAPTCGLDPDTKTGNGARILQPGSLTTCKLCICIFSVTWSCRGVGGCSTFCLHWTVADTEGADLQPQTPGHPRETNWQTRFKKFNHTYFILYIIYIFIFITCILTSEQGYYYWNFLYIQGFHIYPYIEEESIFFDAVYCWFVLLFCWLSAFCNDFTSCMAINIFICNFCKTYFYDYGSFHQTRRNI